MLNETAASKFERFRSQEHKERAESFAYFTIPRLMVDPLKSSEHNILHDYQSLGAVLVNNLSAKLGTSLFPPNRPNFRVTLSDDVKQSLQAQGHDMDQLGTTVAQIEREASERLFLNSGYSKLIRILQLLIVTGNALVYRDRSKGSLMVWSIRSYSQQRSPDGKLQEAVLKQRFKFSMLSESQQALLLDRKPGSYTADTDIDLYTLIKRHPGTTDTDIMTVGEEVDGTVLGETSTYPEHLCPWFAPVWNVSDGEHYGRGLVEDYSGDFGKYSLLSEQLGLYELESLNLINVVDEGSGASADDYEAADTGDYVPGKVDGIHAYERGDYNKMAAISNSLQTIQQRLQVAFMYTGQMRDAERVDLALVKYT